MQRRYILLTLLLVVSMLLVACGGAEEEPAEEVVVEEPAAEEVVVEEPAEEVVVEEEVVEEEVVVEEPAEEVVVEEEVVEEPAAELGGDPVTILSLWGGSEQEAFQQVLDYCGETMGIATQYEQARDFVPVLRTRLAGGNPPDVAIVPRPGVMTDLAREGVLTPLADLGLDQAALEANYGPAWIDLGMVDGDIYGLVVKANSKSTVWYKPVSYEEMGFEIPETYDELVEISEAYVEAGETPWALGAKDTWTLTDWFENIYVRTAGPEMYSQLFSGEIPFTDPSVVEALEQMARITAREEFIAGGIEGALGTGFVDGIGRVFGETADAQMYYEGGFVGGIALNEVNPNLVVGEDIAFFGFPGFDNEFGTPLIGGGDLAVAFSDRPETAALMQCLATPEAGEIWAATGAIVSPNRNVDVGVYPNELARAEAEQVAAAETFRFDGSDLLPGALAEPWGQTLQGVIQNPDDIPTLLEDFESQAAFEFEQ